MQRLRLHEFTRPMRRILIGMAITSSIFVLAVVAYHRVGWSWSDSAYMVIITIFGVGYGEVRPVNTTPLRLITMGVIVVGYAATIYTVGAFVQFLVDGELHSLLGVRRMQREIETLRGHVLICGYGRVGSALATSLTKRSKKVLIIDSDPSRIREARQAGFLAMEGNATEEELLRVAGIEHASVLASVLANDADNVFLTITAHDLNPDLTIFARAEQQTTVKKLRQVGANQVISPTQIGADRLAHLILHPSAESLLKQTELPEGLNQDLSAIGLQLDELEVLQTSKLCGLPISQVFHELGHGVLIVAIRQASGKIMITPPSDVKLNPLDVLIVLGQADELERLSQRFALQSELKKE